MDYAICTRNNQGNVPEAFDKSSPVLAKYNNIGYPLNEARNLDAHTYHSLHV